MEEVEKSENSLEKGKWMYAVYRMQDGEARKLDLLVS